MHNGENVFCSCYFWKFVSRFLSDSYKNCSLLGLYDSSLDSQRRWDQFNTAYGKQNSFLYVDSLMYQSVNLSWKIVAQGAGCVFVYFSGGHKNNLWL